MSNVSTTSTIVLVTGANQGVGFFTARHLGLDHGNYHVVVSGRRPDALDRAVSDLRAAGCPSVEGLVLDVTSDASIAAAVESVRRSHGRLDVLINNAAIGRVPDAVAPRELWKAIFDTNVFSYARVTDMFLPLLEKSTQTRRIVFVSSELGSLALKVDRTSLSHEIDLPEYSSSKAAVNMLAMHYATRLESDPRWKVNLVCPGYCGTNLNQFQGTDDPREGAKHPVKMAMLGADGPTATYSNAGGTLLW